MIFPIDLDDLDGEIMCNPPGYAPGFVNLKRETQGLDVIKYGLSNSQLGDVGSILLERAGEYVSVTITPPQNDAALAHHKLVIETFFDRLKHSELHRYNKHLVADWWLPFYRQWQEVQ